MTSRIRVTHLSPALFGRDGVFGGGERYAFELARQMASVVPTTLVSFGGRAERFTTPEGLRVQVLGPSWAVRGQVSNPLHSGLIRAVASADVIHCHQTHLLSSELAALLGRLSGRRVFATDLGGGGWSLGGRFQTSGWFHGHLHISEYSRLIAGGEGNLRHRVIFGGVDTDTFSLAADVPREPLVVYVGRLMPHKGVDVLLQALPPGLSLEIIGRPYHEEYQARLRQLAVGKRVIFRIDCTDADLVRAYRRARCVVLPSVYRDCYGNESRVPELLGQTPLEGMACGTPAIVSDAASLPEVVTNGVNGFVVPANDVVALRAKLEFLRDEVEFARRLGEAGRQWVTGRFTWSAVVRRCLAAYVGDSS